MKITMWRILRLAIPQHRRRSARDVYVRIVNGTYGVLHGAWRRATTAGDRLLNRVLPRGFILGKEKVKYEYYWRKQRRSEGTRNNTVGDRYAVEKLCSLLKFRSVLDVGCGPGQSVLWLLEHGYDAQGCDISRHVVNNPIEPLRNRKVLHCALASRLPFPDQSFDVVFCTDVMEHVPTEDVDTSIREMARVARNHLFLTICLYPSSDLNDVEYHATVRERPWWERRFESAGLVQRRDLEKQIQGTEFMIVGTKEVPVEFFIFSKHNASIL